MGDIGIPEGSSIIYHDAIGGWMNERDWVERFNMKYQDSKYIGYFKEAAMVHFVAFFTTGTQDHPKKWRHVMRLAGAIRYIPGIPGKYIEVRSLARIGITDDKITGWYSIADKFSDDDEIKVIQTYEVPTIYLGDIYNYTHLLGSLSAKVKEESL